MVYTSKTRNGNGAGILILTPTPSLTPYNPHLPHLLKGGWGEFCPHGPHGTCPSKTPPTIQKIATTNQTTKNIDLKAKINHYEPRSETQKTKDPE